MIGPGPNGEVRACAVCSYPLDWAHGTGGEDWVHTLASRQTDHPPVPVAWEEIQTTFLCDFCGAPGAAWAFPADPIDLLTGHSPGDWSACDVCKELIDTGRNHDLAEHSLAIFVLRFGEIRPAERPLMLAGVTEAHDAFRSVRSGPAYSTRDADE